MRKLLSIVLCLSMILSIFTCVSVSAETETEQKNLEFVAQGGSVGGSSISGVAGSLYYAKNGDYLYYKFKIPKGTELTSASLRFHAADKNSRECNVTPYVVTDDYWQNDTSFTAPSSTPTMVKMCDAISVNLTGSNKVVPVDVTQNDTLKNTINTLAAAGKDYVVVAVLVTTSSTKDLYFVNYSNDTYKNNVGEYATLSATGTFEKPVQKNFEFVAQGGSVGGSSISGVAGSLYYAKNGDYLYYKFKIPKGTELTSASLRIHAADKNSRVCNVTPYVVTDDYWQDDTSFTAPSSTPTMVKMCEAIPVSLSGSGAVVPVDVTLNDTLKNTINTLAAAGKDYVVVAVLVTTSSNKDLYFVNYSNSTYKENVGEYATLSATGTFEDAADFSDSDVTWDNESGTYTVKTAATSGTAMLIVASFDATGMVDAKVTTINAEDAESGVISGTIGALEEGTTVKAFLWNPTTLAPIIDVIPIP